MILDKIENISLYSGISENIKNAIEYIKNTDFSQIETGRHEINDKMFLLVNEYETKENELGILEAHRAYIDFQYIIDGSEIIEYELLNNQKEYSEYNQKDDYILFYNTDNKNQIKFEGGMFAILYPNDLHLPGVLSRNKSKIRKVVLKVALD